MNLSAGDVEALLYCLAELVDRRRRSNVPVPEWMLRLNRNLDLASLLSGMSVDGHESEGGGAQLDLVDIHEAAGMLGCTARHVRRLTADLDGHKVGRTWVFDRQTVADYARESRAELRGSGAAVHPRAAGE